MSKSKENYHGLTLLCIPVPVTAISELKKDSKYLCY